MLLPRCCTLPAGQTAAGKGVGDSVLPSPSCATPRPAALRLQHRLGCPSVAGADTEEEAEEEQFADRDADRDEAQGRHPALGGCEGHSLEPALQDGCDPAKPRAAGAVRSSCAGEQGAAGGGGGGAGEAVAAIGARRKGARARMKGAAAEAGAARGLLGESGQQWPADGNGLLVEGGGSGGVNRGHELGGHTSNITLICGVAVAVAAAYVVQQYNRP